MSKRYRGVNWYCDRCNASLDSQLGFDDSESIWYCTECGYPNAISIDNIFESREDFLNSQQSFEEDYGNACASCGESLSGGYLTLPWEDGDNPSAYVTCPHCGSKNYVDGYGADD